MKCQQCGTNRASINMTIQMNDQQKNMRLCTTCYANLQKSAMNPSSFFGQDFDQFSKQFFQQGGPGSNQGGNVRTKQPAQGGGGLLDELGKNVSDDARSGKIDPVIGRDQEIKRVIETLNRRSKNNPVLICEHGV